MKKLIVFCSILLCLCVASCGNKNADQTIDESILQASDTAAISTATVHTTDSLSEASAESDTAAVAQQQGWTEEGSLKGKFSVSADKKVNFAKGNLQYNAKNNVWRFAARQYEMLGAENENVSSRYDGWIDLFGWGTSGYDNKAPYMTIVKLAAYGNGATDISGTNYDWGLYNPISNGGNKAGAWRTLTQDEWKYIVEKRPHALDLFACATVCGVHALIILPDDWKCPDGITFVPSVSTGMERDGHYYHNNSYNNYSHNEYTFDEWQKMEDAGAVLLPAAGFRYDKEIDGDEGGYWLGSHRTANSAYNVVFSNEVIGVENWFAIYFGRSVRLVQDAK